MINRPKLGGKTLSLRRSVESSHVRQNFSHGRSKAVLVEKKRKRAVAAPGTPKSRDSRRLRRPRLRPAPPRLRRHRQLRPTARPRTIAPAWCCRTLTNEEKDARAQALVEAREREAEERKIAEQQAAQQREEEEERAGPRKRRNAEANKSEEAERQKLKEEEALTAERRRSRPPHRLKTLWPSPPQHPTRKPRGARRKQEGPQGPRRGDQAVAGHEATSRSAAAAS